MTYFLTKCTTLGRLPNTTLQKFSAKGGWGKPQILKLFCWQKNQPPTAKVKYFHFFGLLPLSSFQIFLLFLFFIFFLSYFKTWSEVNGGRWGKRALGTRRQSRSHYSPPVCWPCYSFILLFFHSTCFYFCFCFVILTGGRKSFGIHLTEKTPRHLVRIVFWSAMGPNGQKMSIFGQKIQFLGQIWPFMGQKS